MALTAAVVTIGVRLLAIRFGWRLGAVPGEPGP
jgi:hypothetical protein